MRTLLIAIFACACVTPESELDESVAELWDDDNHCPSGGGGGGGGGNPDGGPGPKPDRKPCENLAQFPTVESCKECCSYNNNHVDGWECRRKKTPAAREKCWREANEKMGKCNRQCEEDRGGITTINPTFP